MNLSSFRWLSSKDASQVARLQFFAKGVIEGLRGGLHRSRHIGSSVEFKEHRAYVAGDETRSIDWKLFGKTDRLYVRQYEDETNLRCTLLLDQSGSMQYAGSRANGQSKHVFAVRLAACLATLFVNQQDSVGLATFDSAIRHYLPPRSQPNHLRHILERLANAVPGGESELSIVLQHLMRHCKARGVIILLSDCFGDVERFLQALAMLRSNHQEVVVFQILDPDEVDFPFVDRTLFRSLEAAEHERLLDPLAFRQSYLDNFIRFQDLLRQGAAALRIDWNVVMTSEFCGDVLARYLARRSQSL